MGVRFRTIDSNAKIGGPSCEPGVAILRTVFPRRTLCEKNTNYSITLLILRLRWSHFSQTALVAFWIYYDRLIGHSVYIVGYAMSVLGGRVRLRHVPFPLCDTSFYTGICYGDQAPFSWRRNNKQMMMCGSQAGTGPIKFERRLLISLLSFLLSFKW